MQKAEKPQEKPLWKPTKEPDIAFWFDKEDPTCYLVRVNVDLQHIQLLQACFDLLAKAVRSDEGTKFGEGTAQE